MKNISIITVNYNNKNGLFNTIHSVGEQQNQKFEYIIIDGGSTDGSVELIEANSKNLSYWISEKDRGIYNAMNKGISKANGEYLMFLNSGDCLSDSSVIDRCYRHLNAHPEADVVYGNVLLDVYKKGVGNDYEEVHYTYPPHLDLKFLTISTINHQSSLISSSLFNEFGLYPETYRIASDYWLFLNSFIKGKNYSHLAYPLIKYDTNGISASNNYESYLLEKNLIWDELVPAYAKVLFKQNEALEHENLKYKNIVGHKAIKTAIALLNVAKSIKQKLYG